MKIPIVVTMLVMLSITGTFVSHSIAFRSLDSLSTEETQRFPIVRPQSQTVRVVFPDSSTTFEPGPAARSILRQSASASIIYISGRTSTINPTARDEFLAFRRAASARKYLIENYGVSPLKIMVNYASATDYIADNSTPEGRLQNQRVDIELIHHQL